MTDLNANGKIYMMSKFPNSIYTVTLSDASQNVEVVKNN